MLPKSLRFLRTQIISSVRLRFFGLAVLSLNVGGCALWTCDDGYCPVPYEPVYVVPADPAPGAPGVYYYTPSASFYYLGQAPTKVSAETQPSESNLVRGQETYDDFPTFDDSFPTVDFHTAPPESSELSEFATTGAEAAEPTTIRIDRLRREFSSAAETRISCGPSKD